MRSALDSLLVGFVDFGCCWGVVPTQDHGVHQDQPFFLKLEDSNLNLSDSGHHGRGWIGWFQKKKEFQWSWR